MTEREHEVLRLVYNGLPTKKIAASLGISQQTVRHHISAIHREMGTRTRVELLAKLRDGEVTDFAKRPAKITGLSPQQVLSLRAELLQVKRHAERCLTLLDNLEGATP